MLNEIFEGGHPDNTPMATMQGGFARLQVHVNRDKAEEVSFQTPENPEISQTEEFRSKVSLFH
jgi:hypothetical protein